MNLHPDDAVALLLQRIRDAKAAHVLISRRCDHLAEAGVITEDEAESYLDTVPDAAICTAFSQYAIEIGVANEAIDKAEHDGAQLGNRQADAEIAKGIVQVPALLIRR